MAAQQGELDLGLVEQQLETAVDVPGNYSAERLLISHPDRYEIARRLYFEYSFSKRTICEMVKIGPSTLNALIEREVLTRGGEILTKRGCGRRSLIKHRLIERVAEMVDDDERMGEMKPSEVVQLIKDLDAIEDRIEKKERPNRSDSSDDPIEAEYVEAFNGLNAEKVSAREERQ